MDVNITINIPFAEKLIDVTAKGLGKATAAYLYKRMAEAEIYEYTQLTIAQQARLKQIAETFKDVDNNLLAGYSDTEISVSKNQIINNTNIINNADDTKTISRIRHQENKKQRNLEAVLLSAAQDINTIDEVIPENINEDIINRIFDYAKNITDTDLQSLWGRILAGEIKQPNSFNIGTLDILRNLSKSDLNLITKLKPYLLEYGETFFFNKKSDLLDKILPHHQLLNLVDQKIIQPSSTGLIGINLNLYTNPHPISHHISSHNKLIIINIPPNSETFSFDILTLTQYGKDLFKLTPANSNNDYLNEFYNLIKKENITIKHCDIIMKDKDKITHSLNFLDFPIV